MEKLETASIDESGETNVTEKIGAKCFVEGSGKVNCSNIIYEDERSWRKSRNQIDLLIQVLKGKIAELKGIKKHLKHNKPIGVNDDEGDDSSSEESSSKEHLYYSSSKKPFALAGKKSQSEREFMSSSTTAPNEIYSTRSDFDEIAGENWSDQSKSSTTPLMTSTTRTPSITANRTMHRVRGHSGVHRGHHNTTRGSSLGPRRTTPSYFEGTSPVHRRNGTRPIKHSNATRRMHTTTTPGTTSSPEGILQTIPDVTTASIESLTMSIANIRDEISLMTTVGSIESSSMSTQEPRFEKGSSTQTDNKLRSSVITETARISSTQRTSNGQPEKEDEEETDQDSTRTECFCEQDADE